MRLRSQLVLVSLLVLLLPWAGCSYVSEMETALRQGQQDALVAVTRSMVSMVNGRPDLLEELLPVQRLATAGADLYLHDIPRLPVVDGYEDDDIEFANDLVRFIEADARAGPGRTPMQLSVWQATDGDKAYLYAHVVDDSISFRNPVAGGVSGSDYLQLTLDDANGNLQRFWISPEAPGKFTALKKKDRKFVSEYQISGVWLDAVGGYTVELTLPRAWLHQRFGIVAVDSGEVVHWAGSMAPGTRPGRLISTRAPLAAQLELIAQDNLRVSVIDDHHWLLAESGSLSFSAAAEPVPGAWMIESLYRMASPGQSSDVDYQGTVQGKLLREELDVALTGQSKAIWYPTDTKNNLAIISAAMPLRHEDRIVGAVVAEQTSAGILSLTNVALVRLAGISSVLVLLIVGGLIGYASWLSVRIHRLSRQVSVVMEPDGRELHAFPPQTATDEIGTLGRSFARLLSNVRTYTGYLQTLASKLSHELRTPLAVVRSSLDNLEHQTLPPDAEQYLRRARDGSERLSHILNAMSEASRVEHSISSAEKTPVNLVSLVKDVVAGYGTVYPQHNITCNLPDRDLVVTGNAELLAQMLDKLMDNARDFCPADGEIRFGVEQQGSEALITVENDGPLLPPEMADQLFESMVSVRESKDKHVHMGLGLTIVRLVAEFHGGTATVENRRDGSGVMFLIKINGVRVKTRYSGSLT